MDEKDYQDTRKYIGSLIYHYRREKKNISMDTLANQINLDSNNLRRIEAGKQMPNLITMIKLLHALQIDANELKEGMIELIQDDEEEKYT